jgi:hypothetical protein
MVGDPAAFSRLEAQVGRTLDIASYFYGYGDWFPTAIERGFAADGRRDVLISWDMGPTRFAQWSSGRHDEYLRTIGRLARDYPYEVFVRPWPEMNGDWQTYLPTAAGDRPHGGTPQEFVAAWRHVVTTVREAGGTNIQWVFNPYAATYPGTADVTALWPGRAYVDVLGIDGYNWGGGVAPWQSFSEIFSPMYRLLTGLDPDLPVWICEFASKEPARDDGAPRLRGRSKGQWIADAFTTTAFPRVEALIWFHEQKERDWRVDSSASSLTAFRQQVALATAPGSAPRVTQRSGKATFAPRAGRLELLKATARRVTVRLAPATRTPVQVLRRTRHRWELVTQRVTDRTGVVVARRTGTRMRFVAPAVGARLRVTLAR